MTSENAIRSALAKAINEAAAYPRPSVRDEMLMDALVVLANKLRVPIEYR